MRIFAAVLLVFLASQGQANCRQALTLGLDVSGSVDAREYRLQMDGLAGALTRPEVRDAILAFPDTPIRLYVFEWAGPGSVRRVLGWTDLTDQAAVTRVAGILRSTTRIKQDPSTAIGQAMLHGAQSLLSQQDCWRFTLDLSGDGEVIHGPDAFVELALGFEDFENAMARKLLKELASIAVSQLDRPAHMTP